MANDDPPNVNEVVSRVGARVMGHRTAFGPARMDRAVVLAGIS